MVQKSDACIGGSYAHTAAVQQAGLQFTLQLTDLLAEGRHTDLKFQRCTPQTFMLDDLHEITQLSKFQSLTSI
ncbi:hypothetical protein D3C81_2008340 [compost metagenome]